MGFPVNSVEDDSFFAMTKDKQKAYFSTLREDGNAEIYTLTFVEPQLSISDVVAPGMTTDTKAVQPEEPITVAATTPPPAARQISNVKNNTPVVKENPTTSKEITAPYKMVNVGSRRFLFFGIGMEDLNAESLNKLENIAAELAQDPTVNVLIEGHTDNTGSVLLNMALSVKRANSVAKYLTQQGIDPKKLSLKAYGAQRPLVSNDDEREGREINRRIEIGFLK